MGAAASIPPAELAKPLDASDVATPSDGVAEVARLRRLLADAARTSYLPASPLPPAAEIIRRIKDKEQTCLATVEAALLRIDETAVCKIAVDILRDSALAEAKAVDAKIDAGEELRPLEGLPVVVKCNIDGPAGSLSSASTPAFANWRPKLVAPVVDKLLAAGAIVVAKVNMCEMAVGVNAKSPIHGRCLNPNNIIYNCGASSSGTAAAVAAGIVAVGLGSDTAGSLRAPAMCNGVVGMRPSQGRWPNEGVIPCSSMRDTSGAIGSCVSDIALLDHVCTGSPLVTPAEAPDSALAGKKIAILDDWIEFKTGGAGLSTPVAESLAVAEAAFKRLAAEIVRPGGFKTMALTSQDTWELPFLPVPVEDSGADLQAYLDRHVDRPREIKTVADVTAQMDPENPISKKIIEFYAPLKEGEQEKLEAVAAGNSALESAYRGWFAEHNVSAAMIPFCRDDITKIDIEGEGALNWRNEYGFCMHMNEINVPSIVIPVRSVRHEGSGVPCGVLLYGVDDAELLGIAMELERALTV